MAVITGIGASTGRGIARLVALRGCDIDAASAQATVDAVSVESVRIASLHPLDMTRPDEVARRMAHAADAHGGIDILVNAAAFGAFKWPARATGAAAGRGVGGGLPGVGRGELGGDGRFHDRCEGVGLVIETCVLRASRFTLCECLPHASVRVGGLYPRAANSRGRV